MGQFLGTLETRHIGLEMNDKPTFDPQAGFDFERKVRASDINEDELISAKIPPAFRDYCSNVLLEYQVCRYKNMPLLYKCAHERHAYLHCEYEDYLLRMKEFERERRLRERENRVVGVAA